MATPSEPLLPSLGPEPFPVYDPDVFYENTKKLAAFEWEEYYWPQRKARLAWRVEQWRNRVTQLMQADRKWFAHICTLHEELKELEAQNDLNRTPIVIRQFLVTKWALIDLEQVRNETAPLHPLGIITRSIGTPQRDTLLEFLERQVGVGEATYTAECTRNFIHRYGNI